MSPPARRASAPRARSSPDGHAGHTGQGEQGGHGASGMMQGVLTGMTPLHPATPYIGIDEAGRGCLAGPVVAAAVILPPHADAATLAALLPALAGLTDSKKLTAARREALAPRIREHAVAWGLGVVWSRDIERINILQATFHAMWRAVRVLRPGGSAQHADAPHRFDPAFFPSFPLIIDGDKTIPAAVFAGQPPCLIRQVSAMLASTPCPAPVQRAVIGGDALVPAVSAASILAKTFRDQLMTAMDRRFPGYGLALHKGYGTAEHMAAIAALGPCPQHRATFRGVRPEPPQTQGSLL